MSVRLPLDRSLHSNADVLATANRIIRDGGVIAMPTESYYALGACAFNRVAVRRVCSIKGRTDEKPVLILIGACTELARFVSEVSPAARILMDRFWPGPLTLVFKAVPDLPYELTRGTGTVGIRHPGCRDLLELLRLVGPLTGTSANRTGRPPVRTARQVDEDLGEEVDLILDGGETPGGLPSTLVDVSGSIRILRGGPIDEAAIRAVLAGSGILMPERHSDR